MIGAGQLDRRITLRRKTVTNTGLGMTEAWADLSTIWASRWSDSGNRRALRSRPKYRSACRAWSSFRRKKRSTRRTNPCRSV